MSEILYLNVGGVIYTTTRATLLNYPHSMLGSMFSERVPTQLDQNGHYFIDRDGEIFRYVLNFLRSTRLSLPENFKDWELLATEADFFQIPELIEAIHHARDERQKAAIPVHKPQTIIELECKKESMRVMYFRIYGELFMLEDIPTIKLITAKQVGWYREGHCLHIHGDVEDRHSLIQDLCDAGFDLKFSNVSLASISGVGVTGTTTATVEKWLFTKTREPGHIEKRAINSH
ncbi:BTB/POZ domain-containing protein KCTD6-like [Saccoglossus kowalevskii]|uniref:BTB/POZ domain-containing protein KCTD6-like n=1 Tax=Saccoglossus kowalevskii TaxID=10224 RepID=A0ABM0GJF2_SACKO|nr:PREDICTED: BTB/POZ domain-containing protein KCTD6-like [Saccoglossus kowalevskii]